jgi:hypothetical protein
MEFNLGAVGRGGMLVNRQKTIPMVLNIVPGAVARCSGTVWSGKGDECVKSDERSDL